MEAVYFFETSVYLYPDKRRHIREDGVLHIRFTSVYLFLARRPDRLSQNMVPEKQGQVSESQTCIRKLPTSNSDRDIGYIGWGLVLVLLSFCIWEVGRVTQSV